MAPGHRRRVMKKVFEKGIDTLLEHEFLEFCLYTVYKRRDTNDLAKNLLAKFGNLESVCNADIKELQTVKDVGPAAAEYIKLIPSIAKGYSLHTSARNKNKYTTHESIARRCVALLKGCKNEVAYLLCFDNSQHLIKEVKLAEGTVGSVEFDPRKILNAVANTSTTKVVICHNHPSGVVMPSTGDIITTQNILNALRPMKIELVDHIIVVDDSYVSCVVRG